MADLKEYENEYYGHVQTAHEKLALAEAPCTSSEAGRSACVATERALEAAKDVVQLMELEGRMLTGTARGKLQERLRVCRDELTSLKDQLKAARAAARSNKPQEAAKEERIREECFAGSDQHRDEGETSRMISSNDRILRATARLNAAHSVTLDMENTANAILVRQSAPNALRRTRERGCSAAQRSQRCRRSHVSHRGGCQSSAGRCTTRAALSGSRPMALTARADCSIRWRGGPP